MLITLRSVLAKMCTIYIFLFAILPFALFAQNKQISGRVTDEKNEPLTGVTVIVKGTNNGVTTGSDGTYTLNVPQSSSGKLLFSLVGFSTQEVSINNNLNISLQRSEKILEDVVVVGYGTQNRRNITGSIAKIDNKVLSAVPVSSFDAALQGRAAGVQVIQSTGMAGAGTQIRIRGAASITAGGEPLYVIDGIPIPSNSGQTLGAINVNPLSSINPGDIESIEILKDASAAAIYGSRGANGVILITTKRGKKGKPQVSFSSRMAFSNLTRRPELLNTQEFITLYKEAVANDFKYGPPGSNNTATKPLPGAISEADALKNNTDWQDELTQTGVSSFNDLSVRTGSNKLLT